MTVNNDMKSFKSLKSVITYLANNMYGRSLKALNASFLKELNNETLDTGAIILAFDAL